MRIKQNGFTLLEVVLAIALSSMLFVLLGRTLGNFHRISHLANRRMTVEREVCLALGTVQKDISALFMVATEQPPQDQTPVSYFSLRSENGVSVNLAKQRFPNLETLSFVTTHGIGVGQVASTGPVRVQYRLVPEQKERDKPPRFRLERAQTVALKNESMRDDFIKAGSEASAEIVRMTVLTNIKQFAIGIAGDTQKRKGEGDPPSERLVHVRRSQPLFTWEMDQDNPTQLPASLTCYIAIWDESYKGAYGKQLFTLEVPIQSWKEEYARQS